MIADTLSRATIEVPEKCPRIMGICMDPAIADVRLAEIRKTTEEDSELQCLITNMAREKKNLVEDLVRHFYDIRENLTVYNGIVVKGEAIVIPKITTTQC